MASSYIYTDEDLETHGVHTSEHELDWSWEEGTKADYRATLRLEEGDTGPLDVEGPCLAHYSRRGRNGDIRVTTMETH